jgi:murein DD-endopeptidase MepM/ murein hydrolase activator NlpD
MVIKKESFRLKSLSKRSAGIILAALLIGTGSGIANAQTQAYEVFVDGNSIGYVQDAALATQVVANLNTEAQAQVGKDNAFRVDADQVVVQSTHTTAEKMDATQCAAKIQTLCAGVHLSGANLTINDRTVAVDSVKTAEKALEDYKKACADASGVSVADCSFKETISVDQGDVSSAAAMDYNQTMDFLKAGNQAVVQDTVKSGEDKNSTLIASNRGTSVETLAQVNQDKDINAVTEGTVINTVVKTPAATVVSTVRKQFSEAIPFETEEQQDSSLAQGTETVLQEGQNGSKDVDAVVSYENGKEVSRNVITENVTKEAVKCVKKVGTNTSSSASAANHPATTGSGQFWMPASGSIGEIYRDGDPSSNHTGGCAVDILNSEGTPIYASAAGTVTRASWYGGYGNCVEIDHGNGYSTLYGHMSAIGVSTGQTVSQGQCIGEMGSTGSASCNHVHFEIKYNGVAQPVSDFLGL